jgi:cysteinyl-tRNA synthetase
MQWESPWGRGFPGWHIECSAMSSKYLGDRIDIHCGGVDHIPVHHTNEIAQSESASGHKWVNYWIHSEWLIVDGGKMSKSSGEILTVSKLMEEGFNPLDYRYFCLQSRYRKQLMFSYDNLKDAQNGHKKLKKRITAILKELDENQTVNDEKINSYKQKFLEQICDDLNIPNALTVLQDVIKDETLNNMEKVVLIEDFDKVFSMDLLVVEAESTAPEVDEDLINKLIAERNEARASKNWAKADEIRNKLLDMNIEILDTREGTSFKVKQ